MKRNILMAALAVSVTGCANLEVGTPISRDGIQSIRPGFSTKDQVIAALGAPLRKANSQSGEIWIYRHMDGKEINDELTVTFNRDIVSTFSSY